MASDSQSHFSHRLALWTETAIARGRSPFRRAETFPSLLTSAGEERPPLVIWINRDSFMAGGIVLLPEGEDEEALSAGCRCAEALALKHFGTWSPAGIAIWECGETVRRVHAWPLPGTGEGEGIPAAFEQLLEQFKILSVLGALPPASLSPYYFANLTRTAMEGAYPCVAEAVRLAQSERRLSGTLSPPRLARRKTAMTALRLLALVAADRLPPAIQPEGLERAMSFAVDALSPSLRSLLALQEELPLPAEGAVRYHHLFRRLGQVQFGRDRLRAAESLEILLAHEGHRLGGHPLPDSSIPPGALLINPDRLVPEASAELAPAPLLALTALTRELRGYPGASAVRAENCFGLTGGQLSGAIVGTLADRTLPRSQERLELATRLRSSWPNRRIPLPTRTPRWGWEFLHLLGLAEEGTRLLLNLPDGWLGSDFAPFLLDIIREHFTLERLERTDRGLRGELRKGLDPAAETVLRGDGGERRLPWRRLREGHRSLILLSLDLSPSSFALVEDGRLKLLPTEDFGGRERELFLFSRSSLGRLLWSVVGGGTSLPRFEELAKTASERGLPVPGEEILSRLRALPWTGGEAPSAAILDDELARSFGEAAHPSPLPSRSAPAAMRGTTRLHRRGSIAEEIARIVFADGIPAFPAQYLYGHYRPVLQLFAFQGNLRTEGIFFGQVTLRDAAGGLLTVEGEETARALELASWSAEGSVELPQDRLLTAAILDRYCADLRHLKQALLRQCHLRVTDFRGAEALAHRIWKGRNLPPWPLFDEA